MYCAHCGSQLEPHFKSCPGCGISIDAVTPAASPIIAPAIARRFSRRHFIAVSLGTVVVIALAVMLTNFLATSSAGPAAAAELEVITAPGISVEILPSAKALAKVRFDAFDVSPSGGIAVLHDTKLVDMTSGEALLTAPQPVQSFAFVDDALLAIDTNGNLAASTNEGLKVIGKPPVENARIASTNGHARLFFYRNESGSQPDIPALASMEKASVNVLTGSPSPIQVAGGDAFQTLFAIGNSLFQVVTPGRPSLVLTLPDSAEAIIGVGVGGTATYFSTVRAVYAIEDDIVVPLAIGVGGELRVRDGALYVLDARQRRVYRIALADGRPS